MAITTHISSIEAAARVLQDAGTRLSRSAATLADSKGQIGAVGAIEDALSCVRVTLDRIEPDLERLRRVRAAARA